MKWYRKYLDVYDKPFTEKQNQIYDSIKERMNIINSKDPVASICIIAYNEERHLLACLWSLSDMRCKYPIEIIGVDNDSTDKTSDIYERCGVKYYTEKRHSPGYARNCGLEHAKGKYHICIDSDSLYPPKYVETYIKTLNKKNIVGCYGLWSFLPDDKHSAFQLIIYEFLRDIYLRIQNVKRPELNVRGMTFAFNTDLEEAIRFRTDIIRGEDGSLALELKKYGKLIFLTSKTIRIITDNRTMNADGAMIQSFTKRLKKAFNNGLSVLHSKKEYKDENSNLIK